MPDCPYRVKVRNEGITGRFAEHMWEVVNKTTDGYPSREMIGAWRAFDAPTADVAASTAKARSQADALTKKLATWPSWLFARGDLAAGGAGDETPLLFDDTTLKVETTHSYPYGLNRKFVRPAPGEPYSRIAVFDMGGTRLEIHGGGRPLTAPTKREEVTGAIMLKVDDLAAAVDRALAHGGSQVMPPTSVPPASMFAYVASPGGLPVGLVEGDSGAYRKALGMRRVPNYWDQPLED